MPLTSLMVVDIETIPDSAHHEGDDFPILPFHQVVAIGFLEANIERSGEGETYALQQLRCGGETEFSEAQLLDGFFRYFERSKPRLVTYNGRAFDLPVLKYRAMKHGVQAPWLQKGGDRFSNYSYRTHASDAADCSSVIVNTDGSWSDGSGRFHGHG